MKMIEKSINEQDFFKSVFTKKQIVLHHTAGGHDPERVPAWWAKDKFKGVSTPFIIGGKSTTNGDATKDGLIVQTYDSKFWSYHLGLKTNENGPRNKESIAIEICNYGMAKKQSNVKFLSYVNNEIPASDVYDLGEDWRGFRYWHKYTMNQLTALRWLLKELSLMYNIPINNKKWSKNSFTFDQNAIDGKPGIWTHCNYRTDKFDCHPQPELIDMLNSL